MKKLLLILLLFPVIAFTQVRPGLYKFQLIPSNLKMELASGNHIRVADDCRARTPNCGNQVWQIVTTRFGVNTFKILLTGSGKYLSWNDPTENAIKLQLTLQPRYPNASPKEKYQQFKFIINDKGSYQIQPAFDENVQNDFFLGATLTSGANNAVGIFKSGTTPIRDIQNAWIFTAPITPLPVQESSSVIVSAPSENKLDIDIKTGADNLEMKPFQENVEIRIIVRNKADVILKNANKDQSWPNNSIKRVTIPLPANITAAEIAEIHIYRKQKIGGTPTTTIFNIAEKDNWNVDKITATARIKENGVLKMYRFADLISPLGSSNPLFRFVYEGGNGRNEGQVFKGFLSVVNAGNSYTNTSSNATAEKPTFKIETLTGGDDLRGGNDNLNVLIRLKIRPVRNIAINNLNNRENWANFTEKTVTKTITAAPFTFDDIEDIVLRHTGGGGIGADNWYLDKLKITLTIAGETRVLVDQVGAPIHYFKGDSRSKIFQILK